MQKALTHQESDVRKLFIYDTLAIENTRVFHSLVLFEVLSRFSDILYQPHGGTFWQLKYHSVVIVGKTLRKIIFLFSFTVLMTYK